MLGKGKQLIEIVKQNIAILSNRLLHHKNLTHGERDKYNCAY